MQVSEYLQRYKFYNTEYLSLTENDSALIDKTLFSGLYHYFFEVNGKSYHVLTRSMDMTIMMKPEFYILTKNSELDNSVPYCDMKFNPELNGNILTLHLTIYDNPQNPLKVPFIYDIDNPNTSFELSQLLEQNCIDIFFIKIKRSFLKTKKCLFQENSRQLKFENKLKNEIANFIQSYLDQQCAEDEDIDKEIEDIIEDEYEESSDTLYSDEVDYLNIVIDREDVEVLNVKKYVDMLSTLYPDRTLTKKFCERVALFITGYDNDSRELWQIPEVKRFTKELDKGFHYWFYFLDKNNGTLLWITLALYGIGKSSKDKYKIDNAGFSDFLHRQFVYLNEVCMFSNGTEEEIEEITNRVCKYYGI